MPPILALSLCIIFVVFLLKLDNKQYPEATLALWIPTIWMLMNASKPLGIWFGTVSLSMEEGSNLDRNFLSILALIGIIILAKRRLNCLRAFKNNIWVFLLLGFMLVSVLWSDMMFVSFKRWIREFNAVIMAFVVATEIQPVNALKSIFRRITYILIPFSYILIHYFPQYGREYGRWSGQLMWVGVAMQKNGLALLCLVAIIFLGWTLITRRQSRIKPIKWYQTYLEGFIIIMAIWLFMGPNHTLTYSATSTFALTIGSMSFIFFLRRRSNHHEPIGANTITIIVATIIVFGTVAPFYGGLTMGDVASIFGRDQTLTGRTEIWTYLIPLAMSNFLCGHGFGGFWTDVHRAATSSNAHNGYLDTILSIGFIGLIIFSMYLINACRQAVKAMYQDFDWGCLWVCLLITALTHNTAESSVMSFTGLMAAMLLFLLVTYNTKNSV